LARHRRGHGAPLRPAAGGRADGGPAPRLDRPDARRRAGPRRAQNADRAPRSGRVRRAGDTASDNTADAPAGAAPYPLTGRGDARVLAVGGREYATHYSERVIRLLIARKGLARTPPYLSYKNTRGAHFLGPFFRYLRAEGLGKLRVLEVGCSFGHI